MSTQKNATTYNMVIGDDIGNGCVKGCISVNGGNPECFDFQSVVAYDRKSKKSVVNDADIKYVIDDIFNHMEVSFNTSATSTDVSSSMHYLIGEAALSKGFISEFDMNSGKSKADDDISIMLTLSSIAGKALQTYFNENNKIPEEVLSVNGTITLALPIAEYVKGGDETYKRKLLNPEQSEHIVTIHNFQVPVTVKIVFSKVAVFAEGSAAQFAINSFDLNILESMLDETRQNGMNINGITSKHIVEAENTIGIDIGDGTVNFPVFTDGKFDNNRSSSINGGHGKILEEAVEDLEENFNMPFRSRKELSSFLNNPPAPDAAPTKINRYNLVAEVVENHEIELTKAIAKKLHDIKRQMPQLEAIFVYGGGATPVKKYLFPRLIDCATIGDTSDMIPVLYMDSNYSRFLNRQGLFTVANVIANA